MLLSFPVQGLWRFNECIHCSIVVNEFGFCELRVHGREDSVKRHWRLAVIRQHTRWKSQVVRWRFSKNNGRLKCCEQRGLETFQHAYMLREKVWCGVETDRNSQRRTEFICVCNEYYSESKILTLLTDELWVFNDTLSISLTILWVKQNDLFGVKKTILSSTRQVIRFLF